MLRRSDLSSSNFTFVQHIPTNLSPAPMKSLKTALRTIWALLILVALTNRVSAQCTLTFPSNSSSVPAAGSTLYFTDCDGNGTEVVSWTAPTASTSGTCGSPSVSQGGGPTNNSAVGPGNYVVTYSAQAVDVSNFSIISTTYSFNVVVQSANPTAGGITNAQTICSGSNPNAITSATDGTQGTGNGAISSITYKWEVSTDNSTWNPIAGATSSSYDPGSLTQTTYYRRATVVNFTNAACSNGIASSWTPSVAITVVVPTAGAIGSDQIFCDGTGDPVLFTNTTSGTGSGGVLAYAWSESTNLTSPYTWSLISGATSATYNAPSIGTTTFFARQTTITIGSTGEICYSAYTAPVKVGDWRDPVISCQSNQTLATNTSLCGFEINNNSLDITASDPESCVLTYDYDVTNGSNTIASDLTTLTGVTLDLGTNNINVTVTDEFGHSSTCSYVITVVKPVVANQNVNTVCSGTALGVDFASSTSAAAAAAYNVTNINTNNATADQGNDGVADGLLASSLSQDIYTNTTSSPITVVYTVVPVSSSGCLGDQFTVSVVINPMPEANAGPDATICSYSSFPVSGSFSGGATSATWSTDGTGTLSISNISSLIGNYAPSAQDTLLGSIILTLTTNEPDGPCVAQSDLLVLYFNSVSPGVIAGDQTICTGGDPVAFTVGTPATGDGSLTYEWEESSDNSTWFLIANENGDTYDPGVLTQTTYYRRKTISTLNTVDCYEVSNVLEVTVVADPSIATETALTNTEICVGGATAASVTAADGTRQKRH
ncbi:MAG: hypothetical protein RLZZ211_1374 [Bacteroidota bacterium]